MSGLAKINAADSSCIFSVRLRSRQYGKRRAREDRAGLAERKARHAHVVREYVDRREERDEHVLLEMQNWFGSINSERCSPVVGRPNMIGKDADGDIKVYDVKTGQLRSTHGRWRGKNLAGCVLYGAEVPISSDSIDDEFREQVAGVMRHIVSEEPAQRVPCERECTWCVVSSDDCPRRIEQ